MPVQVRGEVLDLRRAGAYHALTLVAPGIAEQTRPGHFVALAVGGEDTSMLLRRSFSVYRVQERGVYGGTVEIVFAVPPDNDVDIFAHDLGFIAIVKDGKLTGWNVTVGGGMGMTHGELDTFPRTADVMGFCNPDQVVDVAEKIVTVQRDWGNRELRKRARLKYTI